MSGKTRTNSCYTRYKQRRCQNILEYTLNFTEPEVDFLVDHLLEIENSTAPYFFFTDNCSYEILALFEVVRPQLRLTERFKLFTIPIDTVKILERETNLIKDRKFKISLKTDYLESYKRLNELQKQALDPTINELIIPTNYNFSAIEKAEVYETAMKHYAIETYRKGQSLEEPKHKLYLARAALGPITETIPAKNPQPPELSHDSSAMYLGYGSLLRSSDNLSNSPSENSHLDYLSFRFRNSFHDLEQVDFGTVAMSHIEMMSVDFRYYFETKKTSLHRLTLLNIINTNPSTALNKNIAWKFRLDILDQWAADMEVGSGVGFEFSLGEAARLVSLFNFRGWKHDQNNYTAGLGPELLFVVRPMPSLGLSASATYFGILKSQPYLRLKGKMNWSLGQNYDLQFEAETLPKENADADADIQIRLLKNFIL